MAFSDIELHLPFLFSDFQFSQIFLEIIRIRWGLDPGIEDGVIGKEA
ncbi:MAG: hypothetical protein M3H12_17760 [Chromatiales bacterium]